LAGTSPTVPKRQLGTALRRYREARELSRDVPAGVLECSPAKIGRIETGDVGVVAAELRALLDLYEITGEERSDLERLAQQSRQRRRSTPYSRAVPDWFRKYVNLEEVAEAMRNYDNELILGLCQTEDYARALISANTKTQPGDVDRAVQARLARQERLAGPDAIQLHVVMAEAAVRIQIGGPKVMRAQLERLRELTALPNITIQIIPFSVGAHAATGFPFSLLRLPKSEGLDVVYLEDLTSARYVDNDPVEQERYGVIWSHLIKAALTPDRSARLLATLRKEQ
jgi:transcriptional regulator with XRE-family HTH domain